MRSISTHVVSAGWDNQFGSAHTLAMSNRVEKTRIVLSAGITGGDPVIGGVHDDARRGRSDRKIRTSRGNASDIFLNVIGG